MKETELTVYRERALLIGILSRRRDQHRVNPLDELVSLSETAGAIVVDTVTQSIDRPTPRFYIGTGKVREIAQRIEHNAVDVVIFDRNLTPTQIKNLEEAWGVKVVDRTELILDIFATHARTKQAKLQVELAQLEYTLPRLKRMWTHLSRQEGSIGIAQRGPGEKQLEVDRRLARQRITDLKYQIQEIEAQKQREVQARSENYTVCLVGYTNAGKSTLMKALCSADVPIDDRLFCTLDTRTRIWPLKSGLKILLSDTVGFIRDLPHILVSSFHATLEEVRTADLLLHIIDASAPDVKEQITAVNHVLYELKCDQKDRLWLFNKIDLVRDRLELQILQRQYPGSILISALNGEGLDLLETEVEKVMLERFVEWDLWIPVTQGKSIAELHRFCKISSKEYKKERIYIRARIPRYKLHEFEPFRVDGQA